MDNIKKGSVVRIVIILENGKEIGFEAVIKGELQSAGMKVNELKHKLKNITAAAHAATDSADKLIKRLRNDNKLLEASVDDLKTQLEDLEGRIKSLEKGESEDEFQVN